jgi:hypothetical protein
MSAVWESLEAGLIALVVYVLVLWLWYFGRSALGVDSKVLGLANQSLNIRREGIRLRGDDYPHGVQFMAGMDDFTQMLEFEAGGQIAWPTSAHWEITDPAGEVWRLALQMPQVTSGGGAYLPTQVTWPRDFRAKPMAGWHHVAFRTGHATLIEEDVRLVWRRPTHAAISTQSVRAAPPRTTA